MSESTQPEPRWRILAASNLEQLKTRAKEWLRAYRNGHDEAARLFAEFHPDPPPPQRAKLADAQLVLARAHDYPSWPQFSRGVRLFNAICADNPEQVLGLIRAHPRLLNDRVNGATSNWGPPLVCAAQVGSPKVLKALLAIPGQDLQWALDRAVLKGRLDMARTLMSAGAAPQADSAMGPAETLSVEGLQFLAELGAPLTDDHGDPLAPVALILQGYYRDPPAKHACLEFFAKRGIGMPDTPVMALHRGRIDLLEEHLAQDPELPNHNFAYRDVYPLELGCDEDPTLGLHGTPLDGAALLHMAVDFDELDIARWLLDNGADPNLRARVDAEGFGGHTPLHSVVVSQAWLSGRQRDGQMCRLLLDSGADPSIRASIRKGIRFIADESMHEYRDVTPAEYGRAFHAPEWVSTVALELLD